MTKFSIAGLALISLGLSPVYGVQHVPTITGALEVTAHVPQLPMPPGPPLPQPPLTVPMQPQRMAHVPQLPMPPKIEGSADQRGKSIVQV